MNLGSESKILENESSDEVITEKISLAKAADSYSTLLKFSETWPCYLAQEVMQLHILHFTFLQKPKECTRQAGIHQMLQKACKFTWISCHTQRNNSDEASWNVHVCGESKGIRLVNKF